MKTIKVNNKNFIGGVKMRKFFAIFTILGFVFVGCSMPTDSTIDYTTDTEVTTTPEDEDTTDTTSEDTPTTPETPDVPATPVNGGDVEVDTPEEPTDNPESTEPTRDTTSYTVTIKYLYNGTVIGTNSATAAEGSTITVTHEDLSGSYTRASSSTHNTAINELNVITNESNRCYIFKTTGRVYKYVDYKTNYLDKQFYNEFYFDETVRTFDGWYLNNERVDLNAGYEYTVTGNATLEFTGRINATVESTLQRKDFYEHSTVRTFNPANFTVSIDNLNPATNENAYKYYPYFGELLDYANTLSGSNLEDFIALAKEGIYVRTNDWTSNHMARIVLENDTNPEYYVNYSWHYEDNFSFNATQAAAQPLANEVISTKDFSYFPTTGRIEQFN